MQQVFREDLQWLWKWNRLMGVREEEAGRGALAAAAGGGQQGSCYGGDCCMVIECEDDGCWQFLW
jgi:hypothetical protein